MKLIRLTTKIFFPVLILAVSLGSCKKIDDVTPEAPTSIFDVKASSSFNWKTDTEHLLQVKGMELPVTIKNNLTIQSLDGQAVYYTGPAEMNRDYSIKFVIPTHVKQVKVSFGTITKTLDVTGSTMSFNYLSE